MRTIARLMVLLAIAGWKSETGGSTGLEGRKESSPPGMTIDVSTGPVTRQQRRAETDPPDEASDPLDPAVRRAIAELIEGIRAKDDRGTDELISRIKARQAVHAAVLRLNRELDDPEPRIRRRTASVLGAFGAGAVASVPNLSVSLRDLDSDVREHAAWALGKIGQGAKGAIPSLFNGLRDSLQGVRRASLWALRAIAPKDPEVISQVCRAYRDSDEDIRKKVIEILDGSGSDAPEVLETLILASNDRDKWVREEAAKALVRIMPESAAAIPWMMERFRKGCPWEFHPLRVLQAGVASVPILIDHLSDESPLVRSPAAYDLGELGPGARSAVASLLAALNDDDEEVRSLASRALIRIGLSAIPALALALDEGDAETRVILIRILGEIGPAARGAVPRLVEALHDPDLRSEAIEAVGRIGGSARLAIAPLIEMASAPGNIDRAAAIASLGRIAPDDPAVQNVLTVASTDRSEEIRAAARWARVDDEPPALPPVERWIKELRSDDEKIRASAAESLVWVGPEARPAIPLLMRLSRSRDYYRRTLGAIALGRIGPEAIPELLEALGNQDVGLRRHAAEALGYLVSPSRAEVPALLRAVHDTDRIVRTRAIRALGLHGPDLVAVAPAVLASLEDPDEDMREAGIWALCRLCPDSLPQLIQGLESPNVQRRRASARVLCYLGLEARPASKALERALDDDDPLVRSWARQAVVARDPRGAGTSPALIRACGGRAAMIRQCAIRDLTRPLIRERAEIAGRERAEAMRPVLLQGLNDTSIPARRWAAMEFDRYGGGAAVAPLVAALADRDVGVRGLAASALGAFRPEGACATRALIRALGDGDPEVRWRAAHALGGIGPRAREAIPALLAALKDDAPWVRANAAGAL